MGGLYPIVHSTRVPSPLGSKVMRPSISMPLVALRANARGGSYSVHSASTSCARGPSQMTHAVEAFADFVTLVYHEGRSVRHLQDAGHPDLEKYDLLRNLARNRESAWDQLQSVREAARKCASAKAAEKVFHDRFKVSLEDLANLYRNPGWRHSARGGNRWSEITLEIIELRDSLDQGEADRVAELLDAIPNMQHNTGCVNAKISRLEASRGRSRGERLW